MAKGCKHKYNCLECPLKECVYDTALKEAKREEILIETIRQYDKERHARYYIENREAVLARQKLRDEKRDRSTINKDYYQNHIDEFKVRRRASYVKNRDKQLQDAKDYYAKHKDEINRKRKEQRRIKKIMDNKERIRALIGNLKNWSWDVHPQFRIEKEDALALQDLDALKAYIAEKESYEKK